MIFFKKSDFVDLNQNFMIFLICCVEGGHLTLVISNFKEFVLM